MTPDALAALHARCFPERPWSAAEFSGLIRAPGMVWKTASGQDAFAFARCVPPEAEIITIGVAPEARRRGVARGLMVSLLDVLRGMGVTEIFLEVAEDNTAGRALYAGFGFSQTGRRKMYYARPGGPAVDAVIMSKLLHPAG